MKVQIAKGRTRNFNVTQKGRARGFVNLAGRKYYGTAQLNGQFKADHNRKFSEELKRLRYAS